MAQQQTVEQKIREMCAVASFDDGHMSLSALGGKDSMQSLVAALRAAAGTKEEQSVAIVHKYKSHPYAHGFIVEHLPKNGAFAEGVWAAKNEEEVVQRLMTREVNDYEVYRIHLQEVLAEAVQLMAGQEKE